MFLFENQGFLTAFFSAWDEMFHSGNKTHSKPIKRDPFGRQACFNRPA